MIEVVKRNGDIVAFDKQRIITAIEKAMKNGSGVYKPEIAKQIANKILDDLTLENITKVSIFTIEDKVFNMLIQHNEVTTAKAYEGYRSIREYQRHNNTIDDAIIDLVAQKNDEVMNENSNKNAVLNSTQRDLIAGEISKDIVMRKILPSHLVQAHKTGSIHVHDMDYMLQPMFNCCLCNIGDMLQNGTVINKRKIFKPKSFQVACTVVTQIIAQIASNQYGGQSIDIRHLGEFLNISYNKHLNTILEYESDIDKAKLIAEDLTKKELKAGIQTIQYQVNTLLTSNGQAPFITIFMNVKKGIPYEKEVAMIVEEMLNQRIEGLPNEQGVNTTPAFPKLVYVLNESTAKGGKYYYLTELAAKCTARRLYPDYINESKMYETYDGNCFSPMG